MFASLFFTLRCIWLLPFPLERKERSRLTAFLFNNGSEAHDNGKVSSPCFRLLTALSENEILFHSIRFHLFPNPTRCLNVTHNLFNLPAPLDTSVVEESAQCCWRKKFFLLLSSGVLMTSFYTPLRPDGGGDGKVYDVEQIVDDFVRGGSWRWMMMVLVVGSSAFEQKPLNNFHDQLWRKRKSGLSWAIVIS